MNTITLNHSKVTPDIHDQFTKFAITLGYTIVEGKADEESSLFVPTLYLFEVPKDSNINSAKDDVPMDDYCKENLTDDNFPCELPKGSVAGGFLPMGRQFHSQEGVDAVKKLAEQTGLKFRIGTPHECLLFKKRHPKLCPRCFVVLGTVWKDQVLTYSDDGAGFGLDVWGGMWLENLQVFIVEDL